MEAQHQVLRKVTSKRRNRANEKPAPLAIFEHVDSGSDGAGRILVRDVVRPAYPAKGRLESKKSEGGIMPGETFGTRLCWRFRPRTEIKKI